MSKTREQRGWVSKFGVLGMALVMTGLGIGEPYARAGGWAIRQELSLREKSWQEQGSQEMRGKMENGSMTTQNKFYCNIKALTPAERAHHKELTEKLLAARKETVETAKGYELQFSPASVSLAELSDWVVAESKCCPFFDFHIDLEREGSLLCLRLTGEEGVKDFIRAEFAW